MQVQDNAGEFFFISQESKKIFRINDEIRPLIVPKGLENSKIKIKKPWKKSQ
jgi:hypothetical protein